MKKSLFFTSLVIVFLLALISGTAFAATEGADRAQGVSKAISATYESDTTDVANTKAVAGAKDTADPTDATDTTYAAIATDAESASDAAARLNALGLLRGVGTKADGSPDFALERAPSRAEAVTMVVRLVGMEEAALCGNWALPFTDVPDWAKHYIGYAYSSALVFGVGDETFDGGSAVTPSEYITLILRALGYTSGTDFEWDKAWVLSDVIGITDGRYSSSAAEFRRGDVAEISLNALSARHKDSQETLCSMLIEAGVFTEDAAKNAGVQETAEAAETAGTTIPAHELPLSAEPGRAWTQGVHEFEIKVFDLINQEREKYGYSPLVWDSALADVARAHSADMLRRGFFDHINPDGQRPAERKWAAGITFKFSAESIARGHRSPEEVVNAWMGSPTHRDTILSDMAVSMGVGFHNYYWTVNLTG